MGKKKSLVMVLEIDGRLYGDMFAVGIAENRGSGEEVGFREQLTPKEKESFIKLCHRIAKRLEAFKWETDKTAKAEK